MLQRGGAFKFRGAYNFLAQLTPEERERGVIAPSSGNHAQAVALAAKLFGVPATVVMPTTVTPPSVVAPSGSVRASCSQDDHGGSHGARGRVDGEEGLTLVPPYDHPLIIAGQGTAGLEIAADLPDVDTVLVPVGGGGLSAGVSTAIKLRVPNARVDRRGADGRAEAHARARSGAPVPLEHTGGLADGLLAHPNRRRSRSRITSNISTTWSPSTTTRCAGRCAAAGSHEARRRAERRDHGRRVAGTGS